MHEPIKIPSLLNGVFPASLPPTNQRKKLSPLLRSLLAKRLKRRPRKPISKASWKLTVIEVARKTAAVLKQVKSLASRQRRLFKQLQQLLTESLKTK